VPITVLPAGFGLSAKPALKIQRPADKNAQNDMNPKVYAQFMVQRKGKNGAKTANSRQSAEVKFSPRIPPQFGIISSPEILGLLQTGR
jgi:hypothetical protein